MDNNEFDFQDSEYSNFDNLRMDDSDKFYKPPCTGWQQKRSMVLAIWLNATNSVLLLLDYMHAAAILHTVDNGMAID